MSQDLSWILAGEVLPDPSKIPPQAIHCDQSRSHMDLTGEVLPYPSQILSQASPVISQDPPLALGLGRGSFA